MEGAIAEVIRKGDKVTYDLKPTRDDPTAVGTSEFADAVIEEREFVRLRKEAMGYAELAKRIDSLESKYDGQFAQVFEVLRQMLMEPYTENRIGLRQE